MGNKVIILDVSTINKIAAGEVIERPASIVKELIENSIDAGSSRIFIEIRNGGKDLIKVTDDGIGMSSIDAELAFERHATSKIKGAEDLFFVKTLGFRGEALPSIAAVSEVEMITKRREDLLGTRIKLLNGIVTTKEETGSPDGTTIIVTKLFHNVPARKKFLKKETLESGYISDVINRLALANPSIHFKFINNNKIVLNSPGNNDLIHTIANIYGKDTAKNLIKVYISEGEYCLSGYISNPQLTRSNRNYQTYSINRRIIKDNIISKAVEDGYKTLLPVNRYPVVILNLDLPPNQVDVNVHPSKTEIRFNDEKQIYGFISEGISRILKEVTYIPMVKADYFKDKDVREYKIKEQLTINIEDEKKDDSFVDIREYYPENGDKIIGGGEKKEIKETDEDSLIQEEVLPDLIPIGQLFSTYILAQSSGAFFIIDQHAAHERIIYEELLEKRNEKRNYKQELITPIMIDLTHKEKNIIIENIDLIDELGFEIEEFGSNTILIRAVPYMLIDEVNKQLFIDIANQLESVSNAKEKEQEKILVMIACKSSIKAHDKLSHPEIEALIRELKKTKYPFTCPHGRPTIISMSLYEIEKRFKRK
ncbi:MAG: DNA mismatch repair endonuclease MutL [Firmicutes bacterium]|nr:DNA mismatch repair endonuclease MutL [Bacillota bacterium]